MKKLFILVSIIIVLICFLFFVFLEQPSYPEAQFIGNVSKVDGLSGTFYFNGNEYRNAKAKLDGDLKVVAQIKINGKSHKVYGYNDDLEYNYLVLHFIENEGWTDQKYYYVRTDYNESSEKTINAVRIYLDCFYDKKLISIVESLIKEESWVFAVAKSPPLSYPDNLYNIDNRPIDVSVNYGDDSLQKWVWVGRILRIPDGIYWTPVLSYNGDGGRTGDTIKLSEEVKLELSEFISF